MEYVLMRTGIGQLSEKPIEKDTVTGSSRKDGRPVLFTIGDSTVRNEDKDKNGAVGWGSVTPTSSIRIKNICRKPCHGRRSACTSLMKVVGIRYNACVNRDFVLIQFGHNDAGDINAGKGPCRITWFR